MACSNLARVEFYSREDHLGTNEALFSTPWYLLCKLRGEGHGCVTIWTFFSDHKVNETFSLICCFCPGGFILFIIIMWFDGNNVTKVTNCYFCHIWSRVVFSLPHLIRLCPQWVLKGHPSYSYLLYTGGLTTFLKLLLLQYDVNTTIKVLDIGLLNSSKQETTWAVTAVFMNEWTNEACLNKHQTGFKNTSI